MRYKVGDKVRIKSLDWYEKNKSNRGYVTLAYEAEVAFTIEMSSLCGQIVTISQKTYTQDVEFYRIREDRGTYMWTDDMIEGLVEELLDNDMQEHQKVCDEIMDIQGIEPIEAEMEEVWICPDGYIFKDENGNVINAQKITLEKKKKEYPKTYEECRRIMDIDTGFLFTSYKLDFWKGHLLTSLQKLLICRNAYWRIAGQEMGLGKPWEPDWRKERYIIYRNQYDIIGGYREAGCAEHHIFEFPSPVMRDDFEENFGPEIEICKELL